MMSTADRLVYMVNQIARNLATIDDDRAALAVADHLGKYWEPRMKAQIFAIAALPNNGLSPIGLDAVAILRRNAHPPTQSAATEFNAVDEAGRSDAG